MGQPRLSPTEIETLRGQRAQGIGETVLATAWSISRATVSRYTSDVVRTVGPGRRNVVVDAPARPPRDHAASAARNEAIRASTEPVAALAERYDLSTAHVSRIRSDLPKPLSPRQEVAAVAAGAWRADCMDDADWTHWVASNPTGISDNDLAARPCTDCPLGFAAEMRALNRCNGTPGWLPPDEIEIEEEPPMTGPLSIPNGKEITVALERPCGRCVHEPVCAIRRSLDNLDTLPVQTPTFDRALTVVLTATVDCSHFLAAKGAKRGPRTLNLSPEERERRAASARAMSAAKQPKSA